VSIGIMPSLRKARPEAIEAAVVAPVSTASIFNNAPIDGFAVLMYSQLYPHAHPSGLIRILIR
jgi:hypothetical protein